MKRTFFTLLFLGVYTLSFSQVDTISNNIYQKNGRLGIGTNDPQIKFHIKDLNSQFYFGYQPAFDGPYINMVGEIAGQTPMFAFGLAQKDYIYNGYTLCHKDWSYLYGNIYSKGIAIIPDLSKAPEGLHVNKSGFVGIGTETPVAKLQIAKGDIYISDIEKGIIMKSPDGNCWRGVLDNSGQLIFSKIDCPTSSIANNTQQIEASKSVMVYPNPTGDKITIDLGENFKNPSYSIFSINGQLIRRGKIKSTVSTIDISEFESGIYLLVIDDRKGNNLITKKIVKE